MTIILISVNKVQYFYGPTNENVTKSHFTGGGVRCFMYLRSESKGVRNQDTVSRPWIRTVHILAKIEAI